MAEFVKGMRVKTQQTQYGEIIKIGINLAEFKQNPVNERGYINIDILTSKKGEKYAKINDYKKEETQETTSLLDEVPNF